MQTFTYDPTQIFITFKGRLLGGFADGTFAKISRKEDTWTPYIGTGGEPARARNRNKSGTLVFTVMQTSPTNDFLSSEAAIDEATGLGPGALMLKDSLGTTLWAGDGAYLLKPAEVEYGKEVMAREWTFEIPILDGFVGGNIPT